MKLKKVALLFFLLFEPLQFIFADSCQSNGLGGSFCTHDNGTSSNTIPNSVGGHDTSYSDGSWSSSVPNGLGGEETYNSNGITVPSSIPKDSSEENTLDNNNSTASSNSQNSLHGYDVQAK
jgi:hypothetical protein